jgi:hypothetical protein
MDPDPDADPDPDPAIFVSNLQDINKKKFSKVFCSILFEGIFTSFFKDKKSSGSHKTKGIIVFLTIFA